MTYYSTYLTRKSVENNKNPFLLLALMGVSFYYGFRCYYAEESKNSMLILLFFMSLVMSWRSLTIHRCYKSAVDGAIQIDLCGEGWVWLLAGINMLKLFTEVAFKLYGASVFIQGIPDERVMKITVFALNAKNTSKSSLAGIIALNLGEICMLIVLAKLQKKLMVRVLEEELEDIMAFYLRMMDIIKIGVFMFLVVESIMGNFIYILVIYFVLRQQMVAANRQNKESNHSYFALLRYLTILFFFFRDIFIVLGRVFLSTDLSPLFAAISNERFVRQTILFFGCHLYIYLKALIHEVTVTSHYRPPTPVAPLAVFEQSYFRKDFLDNIVHVFKIQTFAQDDNFAGVSLRTINSYLDKSDPLIKAHLQQLKEKQQSLNYRVLAQVAKKLLKTLLKTLALNFDLIFKGLTYVSLVLVAARNYDLHTFELFDISMILWGFISFIIRPEQWVVLKNYTINVVFPCFVLGMVFTKFYESLLTLAFIGKFIGSNQSSLGISIDTYFGHHMWGFSPLLVYTIIQALRENPAVRKLSLYRSIFEDRSMIVSKKQKGEVLQLIIKLIISYTIRLSRFIALVMGLFSSLVMINIPNTVMLLITLALFWTHRWDKYVWKLYMYYMIFYMTLIQINQTLPNEIESFNYEVLSILGFTKQSDIYQKQFALYFTTCLFASVCYRHKRREERESSVNIEQIMKNPFIMQIESIFQTITSFALSNMVWFFHISILVGMSYEVGDIFSLSLYCVDSLIFVLHIYIKWNSTSTDIMGRNKRLLWSWYPSLYLVIILIFSRYISFYTRYLTVRRLTLSQFQAIGIVSESTTQEELFSPSSKFSKIFLNNQSSQNIHGLFSEFYLEILYLATAWLTLKSLKKNIAELANKENPEEHVGKEETDPLKEPILPPVQPSDDFPASPVEDGVDSPVSPDKVTSADPVSAPPGDPPLSRQPTDPLSRQDSDMEDEKSLPSSVSSTKDVDNGEFSIPPDTKKGGIDRVAFIIFFTVFMIFRTASFSFVVFIFQAELDVLNFLYIGADMLFFNLLFWNITSAENVFSVDKFIKNYLDYFKRAFVDKITTLNPLVGSDSIFYPSSPDNTADTNDDEDIQEKHKNLNIVRDIEHARFYVDQLFIKVKKEVTTLSNYFCFLKVFIVTIKGYFILAEFLYGFYSKVAVDPSQLILSNRQTMLQNTMFMVLILFELLFVKQYIISANDLEDEETSQIMSKFVVMMITKLEYYSFYAKAKVREFVMESKYSKDPLQDAKCLLRTQTSNFERSNTMKQDRKTTKGNLFKRKETLEDRMRSEKISVDMEEVWLTEKKTIFEDIKVLYKKYIITYIELNRYLKNSFTSTYKEYCFQDPEVTFAGNGHLESLGEKKLQFASGPGTSKLLKFLFIHRNTYKFKFCILLVGGKYTLRRLILVPLLYATVSESNLINLPLLLTAILYSLRGSKSISSDLKLFLPVFSGIFTAMFFGSIILNKNSRYGNLSEAQAELENYAKASWGVSRESLVIMSTLFLFIGLSYILSMLLVFIIGEHLLITRKNPSQMYFSFLIERGRQILSMDFLEWKKSVFSKSNFILTLIYDHVLEYYLVFMYLLSVLNPSIYNSLLLIVVLFMITSQMIPYLNKFSISNMSPGQIRNFTFLFNIVIYIMMVNYTCASIVRNSKTVRQIEFWRRLIDQTLVAFLSVLVLNFCISDFMNTDDFKEEKDMLNKRAAIKVKFGALLEAYKQNEDAIFERCRLISKMKELDSIEKLFWQNLDQWKRLKFDFNYWYKDIHALMAIREDNLKKKYMTGVARLRTSMAESIYKYCDDHTSSSFFEDFLYLLLQVFSKNQFLLKGGILNIEDYYGGDFSKYETVYSEISTFYHGLRNKEQGANNVYKTKLSELRKYFTKKLKKENKDPKAQTNLRRGQSIVDSGALLKISHSLIDRPMNQLNSQSEQTKDKDRLKEGAGMLAEYLKAERRHEERIKEDTDVLLCDFGRHRVRFYNLSNSMMHKTQGFQVFRIRVLIKMIMQLFVTRIEHVVAAFIMILQLFKGGMENVLILGIVLYCIMVESHLGHAKWWSVLFYLYLVKCTMGYVSGAGLITTTSGTFINSLFAIWVGSSAYVLDALILISIFILTLVLKMRGFSEKRLIEFEDPGTCIARLVINFKVEYLFVSKLRQEIELFGEKLKFLEKYLFKVNKSQALSKAFGFVREKIEMHIQSVKFEHLFSASFIELLRQARNDLYEASFENVTEFDWRNFSFFLKKPGKDRSAIMFTFFVASLLYVVYMAPTLNASTFSFLQSISQNELMSSNSLIILIFTIFGVIEGINSRRFSEDGTGLERKPIIYDQFERMQLTYKKEELFIKPSEKFRKAYRRICAIFRIRKVVKTKRESVNGNPLRSRYWTGFVFWLVIHGIILHLIVLSNPDQNKSSFQAIASFLSNPQLLSNSAFTKIRLFYGLSLIYFYCLVSQIRYGQVIFRSFVSKLDWKGQISHQVSDLVPFYREMGVLMDFIANKSSLQLRHKLTFNDALYNIRTAKIEEITRTETSYGKHPGIIEKLVVGLVWSLLTLVIVFGPLLPFTSMFNENEPVYIKDASMQVNFADQTGKEIGRLFETQTNVQYHDADTISPYFSQFMQMKENSKVTYLPKTFELLTMSKKSETRSTIEDRFFYELSNGSFEDVYKIIRQGSLVFRLTLILKDNKEYTVDVIKKFNSVGDKEAEELTNLLTSKCDTVNVKRTIQIGAISLIYLIDRAAEQNRLQRPPIDSAYSSTYMWSKLNVNSVCDQDKRKIFSLFNEDVLNDKIQFLIITYETQGSQDVVSRLVGFQIEVILLYVIAFRYLGVSLIRSLFFDKHSLTWFTTLPDPDKLLCLLDAIRYAQLEEDHLREELLFYMLIDIMRNPESLREISGSVKDTQWEVYLQEKKQLNIR
jgi:hypothetical protein